MSATLTETATQHPQKCLFTGDIDGPFIDTGVKFDLGGSLYTHAYLHTAWVEEVARDLLDMRPASEVRALQERVESLAREIVACKEQIEAMEGLAELSERVMAHG